MALTEEAGLHELIADHLTVSGPAGANAPVKVPALVAGMVAGADSITDMGLLRHGGMGRLLSTSRALRSSIASLPRSALVELADGPAIR